ncbi:MAG: TonB-dependent receptor plug domain-containing protein, partial [Pacificimonas sp.]
MSIPPKIARTALLLAAVAPAHLLAQVGSAPADDFHNSPESEIITITAIGVDELDILSGSSIIQGIDLQRSMSGQIGDVLAALPGVSATSFSPGASRPVLRGFQGERVRVLVDGIGSLDASAPSADHAVAAEPLLAERIEILRGPAVLLYGSQAIGGAVNIIDKRIPRDIPDEAFHLDLAPGGGSAANLYEGGASLDIPLGRKAVVHFDGSYRNTDDLSVGGFTVAPLLRADLIADAQSIAATEPEEAE